MSEMSEMSKMSKTVKIGEFLLYRIIRLLVSSEIRIISKETLIYSVLDYFRPSDSDLYI